MTSRELTSGFNFWSRGHLCMALLRLPIGPVVLPLWVVENRPSPLLWPLAYTTACTTVQAVIILM